MLFRITQKNYRIFYAVEVSLVPVHIIVSFFDCHKVKFTMCNRQFGGQFTKFLFIPDGYSKRFVFKAPMVWNPLCAKVLIIFQKHTSSHKENRTLPVEQAAPLQCFVQCQSWKLTYCTLQSIVQNNAIAGKHNSNCLMPVILFSL